jgi:hypothetical protein
MVAIELLELTPHEIESAKRALIARVVPESLDSDHVYERWFAAGAGKYAIR